MVLKLVGFADIMEEYTTVAGSVGFAGEMKGLPTDFNRPQNAVVLGGILHSARQRAVKHEEAHVLLVWFDRITYWLKDLFR